MEKRNHFLFFNLTNFLKTSTKKMPNNDTTQNNNNI